MKKGKLVILAGIDGSGKTTILSFLESKGYFISYWRKLSFLPISRSLNFKNPAEIVQTLKGQERLEFIWKYIKAEWEYLIKPRIEVGEDVVSDGFFIRFL